MNVRRSPHSKKLAWLCAVLLSMPTILSVANACDGEAETAEQVISRIWIGATTCQRASA